MRLALIAGVVASISSAHAAPEKTGTKPASQRMLLAPGCYVLAPGATADLSAYCLDRELPSAPAGRPLTPVGADAALGRLDDAVLRIGGRTPLSLRDAVARHLVEIDSRGGDDYFHVALRNLSGARMELCIRSATVLAAGAGIAADDAASPEARLDRLLPPLKDAKLGSTAPVYGSADEAHAEIQDRIWDAVERVRRRAARDRFALPAEITHHDGACGPEDWASQARSGVPGATIVTKACR